MEEYNRSESEAGEDPIISTCTPLHLAVQCAKKDIIVTILDFDSPKIPIDAPDAHGMTPLHFASKASRKDIVKLLLRRGADDMLLDSQGQDALAYAIEPDVAAVIQDHRSEVVRSTTAALFSLVRNNDTEQVQKLLDDPAESSRINLAARDAESGGTLLHLAVQHDNIALAKWAITQGVDVFAKDSHGSMAEKYAEHHQMRELLDQAPMGNARTALSGKPPKFSGQLHKWTNYASGWKSRWFELESGVLSYYKDKADADSSCRGAINLRIAKVVLIKEGSQFEVHGKGSIKYRLKAKDPAVAKQWVHLLNLSKQWALENHKHQEGGPGSLLAADNDSGSTHHTIRGDTAHHSRAGSLLKNTADASSVSSGHRRDVSTSSLPQLGTGGANEAPSQASKLPGGLAPSTSPSEAAIASSSKQVNPEALGSPASSIMSSESDDELYIARDDFGIALSEIKAQMFIQDRLLEGLSNSRRSASVKLEEISKFHDVAVRSTAQASAGSDASVGLGVTNLASRDITSENFSPDITEPIEDDDDDGDSDFADATDDSAGSVHREQSTQPEVAEKASRGDEAAAPSTDLTALSGYSIPVSIRMSLPEIKKGGPSLNLWSIIKGAIGKDLSKISVPVFFNEPTSFLQRFTEDMEYCDLLEIATLMPRSEDRTLFVAGFAMSNYASTFGRIAKPFNPLLGETYEYVRRDKKYRALSEQVEHHPPISACWVEGKNYLYHADTNIRSKFNGGSLTVIPTGVCHPKINEKEGYFTEHYTWNKLTTNVNGIMIANFWIEHFGDLDVKNHRTGDTTKITFLQSNWMGKNKFKVTGEALNRRGDLVYEIAGDWTSKLDIARPATMDDTDNAGDAVKYAATNSLVPPKKPFVLWKVNERQTEKNTYHLTTYAMSLNDKPKEMDPYLCPTDSRFRPDQRAMETGEYETADREKSRLENKQRATRRRREQGELEQWKPRWFVKDVDEDSGESYWRFTGEYWTERESAAEKQKEAGNTQPASARVWNNVEDIF
ncbi:hypothetical protein GQ54DRAFT_263916 [Martensiomyces pterosporus]|nr:hypothetical protein GQ54DRAFT_263916 [Martensiomyces pterosporus]